MKKRLNLKKTILFIGITAVTVLFFQNCSKLGSSEDPISGKPPKKTPEVYDVIVNLILDE